MSRRVDLFDHVGSGITGSADASVAINDAIQHSNGGTVILPAGEYTIQFPIVLEYGVKLVGDGLNATSIVESADFEGEGLIINNTPDGDLARWMGVSGMSLIGREDHAGISLRRAAMTTLSDLRIYRCLVGVNLDWTIAVHIRDCKIHENIHAGISAHTASNVLNIATSRIQNTKRGPGIVIDGASTFSFTIDSCAIESNGLQTSAPGISIGPYHEVRGGQIIGCHLEANRSDTYGQINIGSEVADARSSGIQISATWLSGAHYSDHAIRLDRADGIVCTANTATDHRVSTYYLGSDVRKSVLMGGHNNEPVRDSGSGKWAFAFDGFQNTLTLPGLDAVDFVSSSNRYIRNSSGGLFVSSATNLRLGNTNEVHISDNKIGFLGAPASSKATVTGDTMCNPALKSLIQALAAKGLITDGTN